MLEAKAKAQEDLSRLQRRVQEDTRLQQFDHPDEVWITKDHTKAQRDAERRRRGENQSCEEDAMRRKIAVSSASQARKGARRRHSAVSRLSDESSSEDDNTSKVILR